MAKMRHLGPLPWAASAEDSVATSGQGKVFSGKSPAQPGALGRGFFVRVFFLPLQTPWSCVAPLFHKLGGQPWTQWWNMTYGCPVTKSDCNPNCLSEEVTQHGHAAL